jgi:hypothetical protein
MSNCSRKFVGSFQAKNLAEKSGRSSPYVLDLPALAVARWTLSFAIDTDTALYDPLADITYWSRLQIAALTTAGQNEAAADLYTYLITHADGQYTTPEQRQALVRRLREALVKLVSVVGIPKPLETVMVIAEREREEDRDYSCSRCGPLLAIPDLLI